MSQEEDHYLLRVGELARRCGKTVRALHLYEELGLLEPDGRSKGGFRMYAQAAVQRVAWIGKLQDMGFSLTEIQVLLRDWSRIKTAPEAMQRIEEIFTKRLKQTEEHIQRLSDLRGELKDSLGYLDRCQGCDADTPDQCAACVTERAPMLITQFHRPPTGEHPNIASLITPTTEPRDDSGQGNGRNGASPHAATAHKR